MLPLYPELKAKLERLLIDIARQGALSQLGPFAGTPRVKQYEGNQLDYMTVDGDEKSVDYQHAEVGAEIALAEIPAMTFDRALELATNKGIELGTKEARFYFEALNRSVAEVGNAIDVGGPFTLDAFFQMLEKMQFPFDEYGNAQLPTLHIGPDLEESVRRVLGEVDKDIEAQARLEAIINKKRGEWNEQQDSRKLVD